MIFMDVLHAAKASHTTTNPRPTPRIKAFSSEVDTGSREENVSKQELEPRSDSIGTEKALAPF
jgi:hypothetical protein